MAREAGAKNVFFASAAPPVKFPNVYGIDMPTRGELISHGRDVEEVRQIIGADRLIFQDLDDLIEAVSDTKHSRVEGFDCSVFDGYYIAGDINEAYFKKLEDKRADTKKSTGAVVITSPVDMTGVVAP